jgi:putative ATP-binding cassette transporter
VGASVLFLPQRPYLPLGALGAVLNYPRPADAFDEAEQRAAREKVGLPALGDRLADEERWDRVLSLGEQQRLAFARLFLHKPDIVVMDEATSALDPESQAMLMEKLAERLPKTAIISVGHRPELEAFHERKVNLVRREGGAKLISHDVVAPPVNILSNFMKRWRAPPAAAPATPTAQASNEKGPKVAA